MAYALGIDLGTRCSAASVALDGGRVTQAVGIPMPMPLLPPPGPMQESRADAIRRVLDEAGRRWGGPPQAVALSHPAGWRAEARAELRLAAERAGVEHPMLVSLPECIVHHRTAGLGLLTGEIVGVYHLGDGYFEAAVVAGGPGTLSVLGQPCSRSGPPEGTTLAIGNYLDDTLQLFDRTLTSARVDPARLQEIVVVGAAARLTQVTRLLRERYHCPLSPATDPQVVALGAAQLAAASVVGSPVQELALLADGGPDGRRTPTLGPALPPGRDRRTGRAVLAAMVVLLLVGAVAASAALSGGTHRAAPPPTTAADVGDTATTGPGDTVGRVPLPPGVTTTSFIGAAARIDVRGSLSALLPGDALAAAIDSRLTPATGYNSLVCGVGVPAAASSVSVLFGPPGTGVSLPRTAPRLNVTAVRFTSVEALTAYLNSVQGACDPRFGHNSRIPPPNTVLKAGSATDFFMLYTQHTMVVVDAGNIGPVGVYNLGIQIEQTLRTGDY